MSQGCRSCETLKGTVTPRVICIFVCVPVYVLNESTTFCHAETSTARSLDFGLIFRIQIDAHRSKPCRRGRPRRSLWSVCTHRSILPIVVAAERTTAVWAIPQIFCHFVCWPCPCLSFCLFCFIFENPTQSLDQADGKHPISHWGPKSLSRTGGLDHYLIYGRPNQIPDYWVKQITMLVGWHVSSG